MINYVTVKKASELTGLSQAAIRNNINKNVWRENLEYTKANKRIFIDMEGFNRWVENPHIKTSTSQAQPVLKLDSITQQKRIGARKEYSLSPAPII